VARTRGQILATMNHSLVGNEPGLIGYWRFDEGSGTNAYDSTGNGNTATLESNASWLPSAAPLTNAADYALSFNAANGQDVTIPHQAAQDSYPLTVMCWFMEPTNSPGGGDLVGNYVSSSFNGWALGIGGQLYGWYWRDSSDSVGLTGAGAVNDGRWHHAAFVVNSTGGVIYLDGVPKQTNTWAGTAGPCTTTEATFLGIYQGDSFLTANEDEVSIWNVALTQSQIQTYMHQPLQGTESGLVSYYRMNEGIGTNIYDYTTNANTGALSPTANPPTWIISGAQIQEPPQLTTLPAAVNGASATLSGTLNPQGLNSGSWFRWGTTTAYGNVTATNTFAAGYGISTNTVTISGLSPGTYYFQIVATNSSGTNYGVVRSFNITAVYQLGSSNLLQGPAAGTSSVVLAVSPATLSWSVTANASWLHALTSSGAGSSNVIFSFDANTGATRTGTLTIANQTLTVTQAGSTYVQANAIFTLASSLSQPGGVAVDGAGNVYIADTYNSTILKWTRASNSVSTVIPVSAGLDYPFGLAIDSSDNLYIADTGNSDVKKWTAATGIISVLASGQAEPWSVAVDSSGNVYIVNELNVTVEEWVAATGHLITIVSQTADYSEGVTVDAAQNVYYSDTDQSLIYEWIAARQASNLLSSASANMEGPAGLAVDGSGNLYIANGPPNTIIKWSAATGNQTTLATSSTISQPLGVAVDSAGNVYMAATGNNAVMELPYAFVDPTTKSYPATAGSDSLPVVLPSNIDLSAPFAPTSDQSWLTITSTNGGIVSYSYTTNNGSPRTAHISLLGKSITISQAGGSYALGATNLLVGGIDGTDSVILLASASWSVSPNATWLHTVPGYQSGAVGTNLLFTFDSNPGAARIGTISIANQTLTVSQAPSNYVAVAGVPATVVTNLGEPWALAFDGSGNAYIADYGSNAICEWIRTNNTVVTLVSGLSSPEGVAVDTNGNVYFSDSYANSIQEWTAANSNITTLVSSGLNGPYGIAVDSAGNVYIADSGNNAVKEWIATNGEVITLVSGLDFPCGVALDIAGNLYIDNTLGRTLEEWSPATGNTTVLASPTDNLNNDLNMAVDGSGNVFMGDVGDGAIQEWSAAYGTVTLAATGFESWGAGVDSSDNIYVPADDGTIKELQCAFVNPAPKLEPFTAGADSLPAVFPINAVLKPPFFPSSDQPWVTITGVTNGVTSFSFSANTTGAPRTANIDLLGQLIAVNQGSVSLATSNLLEGPTAGADSVTLGFTPPFVPFTASADAGWLHVASGNLPAVNVTNFVFSFDANSGPTRTNTVTLGGMPLAVTQAGVTYVAAPAPLTALVTNGLSAPAGVAVDSTGYVYISNPGDQAMDEWVMTNNSLEPIVYGGLGEPTGVALNNAGGIMVYSDTTSNIVYAWAQGVGNALYPFVTSGLNGPYGVALDSSQNIYIADVGNNAIEVFNYYTLNFVTLVSGLNGPKGVAVDAFGDVYFADTGNNAIKEWSVANSNVITIVSSGLNHPAGLAVDASGNIFIADTGDSVIKKWNAATRTLTTLVATGVNHPTGIALDSADDLYIADTGNNMVEELPRAFVDPTARLEPYTAGSDTLPVILPASVNLLPPFAPATSQSWLAVTNTNGGLIDFAFTANPGPVRTAYISVLGESIAVTQTNSLVTPPHLGAQLLGNGAFQFTFTNNPGTTFTVLATTNLTLPLTNWINLGTLSNISPGVFQFTVQPLTNSKEFYRVTSP